MTGTPPRPDRFSASQDFGNDDEPVVVRRRTIIPSRRERRVYDDVPRNRLRRWSAARTFWIALCACAVGVGLRLAGDAAHDKQYDRQPTVRPDRFENLPYGDNGGQPIDPLGMGAESDGGTELGTALASPTDIAVPASATQLAITRMTEANVARAMGVAESGPGGQELVISF